MKYDEFLERAAVAADELGDQARSALYWLLGKSLLWGLEIPAPWANWVKAACPRGLRYATTGVKAEEDVAWEAEMTELLPRYHELSQHIVSAMACLDAAFDSGSGIGKGYITQYAFFPITGSVAEELFEGSQDEDEWDFVFAQPRVQAAVAYYEKILSVLRDNPCPDEGLLMELLQGGEVLSPND